MILIGELSLWVAVLMAALLNLVGARDLATVQRFSDSFLMSKLYCGSLRTGYRPTSEYACGTLSLGTAVSVSGAGYGMLRRSTSPATRTGRPSQ